MSKTKTPFISLGSQGTIGDAITSQKRGAETLLRTKPIPSYRRTLAQQYRRWLYKDYAYLWIQQTAATRQQYATKGTRYHLTGFQYWMKYNLTNLPDIAGMWHLDEKAGALATDFSRNSNHASIFGASPAAGLIDGSFYFDGINDYLSAPSLPAYNLPSVFSFETWVRPIQIGVYTNIAHRLRWVAGANNDGWQLNRVEGNIYRFVIYNNAAKYASSPAFPDTDWHHIVAQYDKVNVIIWVDAVKYTGHAVSWDIPPNTKPLEWARNYAGDFSGKIDIDHTTLYNRLLDETEIKRHSERRY